MANGRPIPMGALLAVGAVGLGTLLWMAKRPPVEEPPPEPPPPTGAPKARGLGVAYRRA